MCQHIATQQTYKHRPKQQTDYEKKSCIQMISYHAVCMQCMLWFCVDMHLHWTLRFFYHPEWLPICCRETILYVLAFTLNWIELVIWNCCVIKVLTEREFFCTALITTVWYERKICPFPMVLKQWSLSHDNQRDSMYAIRYDNKTNEMIIVWLCD